VVAETHYRIECGRGQNQALSALLFLYRQVLNQDLGPIDALRAKKPKRLPTVLTRDEIHRVFARLSGVNLLR
jgi:integrase